jgi:hypothetical protein
MEFRAVVIGGQAGRVLKGAGAEIKLRLGAVGEMLLPPRDQRLLEPGADRFARVETQPAGPGGERKNALGVRGPEPLEIAGQAGVGREGIGREGRFPRSKSLRPSPPPP